jgi:hypothetical protein
MPQTNKRTPLGEMVREQVELAQARIHELQKEAEKTLKLMAVRGRESRKELDRLVTKLEKTDWSERSSELAGKAKDFGAELAGHLDELQGKAIKFVGVASRDQVDSLSREIKRLATKVESLTKASKRTGKVGQA